MNQPSYWDAQVRNYRARLDRAAPRARGYSARLHYMAWFAHGREAASRRASAIFNRAREN
jgi:hypothetical protein